MPVDILALPSSSMNTKWKEPYASASLNQKLVGIVAPGIYRGLVLLPDPSIGDRTVLVKADPVKLDHVAVYENAGGYSVTYRDTASGDITLSLTAYTSTTVVICVFIDYQSGIATTGSFRVYTLTEFNALTNSVRNALVILGTVVVPASGAIVSNSISLLRRTLAATSFQEGMVSASPLVRNPGFELGEINASYLKSSTFWDKTVTAGTALWKTSTAIVASGMKSIELSVSAGAMTGDLSQQVGIETAEGEQFFASVVIKQLKTISSGTIQFFIEWSDVNDVLLTTTTQSLDGGGVDGSFRTVSVGVAAPAGATSLRTIGIRATALSPLSFGVFAYIDDVGVSVVPRNAQYPYPLDQAFRRTVTGTDLVLADKASGFSSSVSSMRFDPATPSGEGRVLIEPGDVSDLPPTLALLGRLYKIGSGLLGSQANALKPRITWDNGQAVTYTLLWESAGDTGGIAAIRQYVDATGRGSMTANALFDGTNWVKDVNGQEAWKLSISESGTVHSKQIAGTNTWIDSAWVNLLNLATGGIIDASGVATVKMPPRTYMFDIAGGWQSIGGGSAYNGTGSSPRYIAIPNLESIDFSLEGIPANQSISSIVINYDRVTSGTVSFVLYSSDTVGSAAPRVSKTITTGTGNASIDIGVSPTAGSLPYTTLDTETYFLNLGIAGGSGGLRIYSVKVVMAQIL